MMSGGQIFLWCIYNTILPLLIPVIVLWAIFWFTEKSAGHYYHGTIEALSDGQLCVLGITLSLISVYEVQTSNTKDAYLMTWGLLIAVFSAVIFGAISLCNDVARQNQHAPASKSRLAWASVFVAVLSVILATYSHYAISLEPNEKEGSHGSVSYNSMNQITGFNK